MGMVGQGPNCEVRFQDHKSPRADVYLLMQAKKDWGGIHTVASMVEIVRRARYAPTAATAGLSFFHHQTAVVPNQTPAIVMTKVKEATNAHGESPPVSKWPLKKNLFRDG